MLKVAEEEHQHFNILQNIYDFVNAPNQYLAWGNSATSTNSGTSGGTWIYKAGSRSGLNARSQELRAKNAGRAARPARICFTGRLMVRIDRSMGEENFVERVRSILQEMGTDPSEHHLAVELTETELMENVENGLEKLKALRDFGSGI